MGTKIKPGRFDCYENALPDEPMFVLLARDPTAPEIVRRWATYRADRISAGQLPASDIDGVGEAMGLANSMEEWRSANNGRWRTEKAPVNVNVDLLAALRIARSYVMVSIEEFREQQDDLAANEPHRPAKALTEDAETLAEIEAHLRLIDAAIAKAEGA